MSYSRREILAKSGVLISSIPVLPRQISQSSSPESGLPTPSSPSEDSVSAVVSEAYGELVLAPERRYWPWDIDGYSDELRIDIEVSLKHGESAPDVLTMTNSGFEEYQKKVNNSPLFTGPLITFTTREVPLFGGVPWIEFHREHLNLDYLWNLGATTQPWSSEDSPMVRLHTLECLTESPRPDFQTSQRVEGGEYKVVFDWSDVVLEERSSDRVSVETSLRAVNPNYSGVQNDAPQELKTLYDAVRNKNSALKQTGRDLASALCVEMPDGLGRDSVKGVSGSVAETTQILSAMKILSAVLESELGYEASIVNKLSKHTTAWTRWSLSVTPVVHSLTQVVEDACRVTEARDSEVIHEIEDMLMSIGILLADLLATKFGVAGRAASFTVKAARKHMLGFVARTLGLKTYLVLLRELYTITRAGISEALQEIKAVTRRLADDWLIGDEPDHIDSLDKGALESLDFDFDVFSLSPECSP